MARSCLFCGSSEDLNREHIFPEWLLKCLDVYHDEAYVYRADEDHPRRKLTYNNLVAKKFCKSCNEGWMKRLEDRVNPLLTQTLESRTSHQLSDDEAQALAVWCIKTAYTLSSFATFEIKPPEHYQKVFQQIGL